MGELPVEDGADAFRADDEVAVAEVAVHEPGRRVGAGERDVLLEPTQAELERGVRLAERVEDRAVLLDLLDAGPGSASSGRRREVDRVDLGRDRTALRGEQPARVRVLVVAQDPAGDRLALDAVHHEPVADVVGRLEQEPHRRHRNSGGRGGLEQPVLGGPIGLSQVRARIAAQDEPVTSVAVGHRVERPALA